MLDAILNFLISGKVQDSLFGLKFLFLACSLSMLAFIVYVVLTTRWFKYYFWYGCVELFTNRIYGAYAAEAKWQFIQNLAKIPTQASAHLTVISCHDLLGRLLERLVPYFQSNTFAERLARLGSGTFTDVKGLWFAHELYRKIKKDPKTIVQPTEVDEVIRIYRQALVDLGVLK